MVMENDMSMRSVTLKEMWGVFVRRLGIILLAAVVVTAGMFLGIQLTYTPRYESTATLYILRQNEGEAASASDFSLALNVVNDCTYLLKSHSVLDETIDTLGLDMTYGELYRWVSTSNPDGTRILEVRVEMESAELAKRVADTICTIGTERIGKAMGVDQVSIYEYGILNQEPCNRTGMGSYVLAFVMAAVLTYVIFLIGFILDDRIRAEK